MIPDSQQSPKNLDETIDLPLVYNTFIRWFGGGGGGTSPGIVGGGGGGSSFINTAVAIDFIVLQGIGRQAGEYLRSNQIDYPNQSLPHEIA